MTISDCNLTCFACSNSVIAAECSSVQRCAQHEVSYLISVEYFTVLREWRLLYYLISRLLLIVFYRLTTGGVIETTALKTSTDDKKQNEYIQSSLSKHRILQVCFMDMYLTSDGRLTFEMGCRDTAVSRFIKKLNCQKNGCLEHLKFILYPLTLWKVLVYYTGMVIADHCVHISYNILCNKRSTRWKQVFLGHVMRLALLR